MLDKSGGGGGIHMNTANEWPNTVLPYKLDSVKYKPNLQHFIHVARPPIPWRRLTFVIDMFD